MIKIDYIIPTYNKSSIVKRALDCLCKQTAKDNLCITLVNDCSPNTDCDYSDLIKEYKDKLDIRVIKTPKNVGAGMARQYGIENTSNPYIMFQDDDDFLSEDNAIEYFVKAVKNADDTVRSVVGGWIEVDSTGNVLAKKSGKNMNTYIVRLLYRDLIDKHNIRFDEDLSRLFEDYDFATKYMYALNTNRYTEVSIGKNHYVYVRDNEFSTMNNTSVQKTHVYHAITEFKKYEFMSEHSTNKDDLCNIINSAYEKSFFAICRAAKYGGVTKDDIEILSKLIEKHYGDLGNEYLIQKDSIIYNVSTPSIFKDADSYYEYFLTEPRLLIEAVKSVLK